MGNGRKGFTHSQWIGIIWVSVSLLLIMAIGFFSSRHTPEASETDTIEASYIKKSPRYKGTEYRNNNNKSSDRKLREKRTNSYRTLDSNMYSPGHAPTRRQPLVVELNSADTAQLRCLHGIGPVFAARIVKYRQLLGGYVRKEQLLEVYGMDEERYAGIAANIVLDTASVTKLRVNDLSIAELKRHPYLDYYQAKAIVDFRNGGRRYQSMDDLRLVSLIDDETATKLQGYIQFN